MVTLVPMTSDEWARWRHGSIRDYAADKVRIGAWPEAGAVARATAEFSEILPEGQATRKHDFRVARNDAGEAVGVLWFAWSDTTDPRTAFIWDIAVEPAFRGRGYGRAVLEALEPIARALGCVAIRLHVFGDNEVARNLYRTSGYIETDVSMVKRLD